MRTIIALIALAAGSAPAAGAAVVQANRGAQTNSGARRDAPIVVNGDQIVCRPVTRTGTRTRVSSLCMSRSEWASARGAAALHEYRSIEEAAAKLAVIGDSCTPGVNGCE